MSVVGEQGIFCRSTAAYMYEAGSVARGYAIDLRAGIDEQIGVVSERSPFPRHPFGRGQHGGIVKQGTDEYGTAGDIEYRGTGDGGIDGAAAAFDVQRSAFVQNRMLDFSSGIDVYNAPAVDRCSKSYSSGIDGQNTFGVNRGLIRRIALSEGRHIFAGQRTG